ncbi:MAG: ABC transporter ATP-binding protein [Gammaproteobacteria bacterium]|nr:ABC transporter ATP-binding protein [Gammaproteobacteria bacterium]
MQNEILVKVEKLFRYYGDHCAVRDVSFELHKGDVLGFLGPNGAGKSTTMQILSGNLAPSAGGVQINGEDLLENPRAAKQAIGYLPEQPPLYPDLTVTEFLEYCAKLNRIPKPQIRTATDIAMQRCGLESVGKRLIANLSKGFQQRTGIAQAIIHSPLVVILDEPTVGLDPIQIREIRNLIVELGREHSVILSTHILPEVQSICNKVQIINRGKLVFSDDISALAERGTQCLLAGAKHLPGDNTLNAIAGVTRVERLDENRARLHCASATELAEQLAKRAVQDSWGLFELTPEQQSLEQIFVELTCADEPQTSDEEDAA